MEQQYFFDKRYNRPFSFDGNLIFSKKRKDSEIKIFEVLIGNVIKYIFVHIGNNNTELYKVECFEDIMDFFNSKDSLYFEFIKSNCELVFNYNSDIKRANNKTIFSESYEIYKFRKDNFNIIIIKMGDSFIYDFIGGLSDHLQFNRLYLSTFLLDKVSPKGVFRAFYAIKKRLESNMKKLNDFNEGEQLYDTGVSSIKENACIGIYGKKIIHIETSEYENCHMIISKSGYYLTLDDAIYFDEDFQRLALILPEKAYTTYFQLDKKYHVYVDDTKNDVHERFKSKNYKQEVIKLNLKVRPSSNKNKTGSDFLIEKICMDLNSDLGYFNRDFDGSCGDINSESLEFFIKNNKVIPSYSSYPIYTNAKLLLKKENNKGGTFFLLKGEDHLLVIVESKNKNYFYNVMFDRILFHLIEKRLVPFTFQEVFDTGNFLKPNSLDYLMGIKYENNI